MTRKQPIELFMPPNMLKAKIGGSFVGMDMAAIKRAETAMEEIKSQFPAWAAADVDKLMAARACFAKAPNADARACLLRAAHDMKGQAATFDYPMIARVAGSLSRLISGTAPNSPLPLDLVDAHVAAIHAIYRDKIMDNSNMVAKALTDELEDRVTDALKIPA